MLAFGVTAAVVLALRGGHAVVAVVEPVSERPSRAGPLTRLLWQLVGTPHAVRRWLTSAPVLTVVTGLTVTALGGAMVDQLVLINDPFLTTGVVGDSVGDLVLFRGGVVVLLGLGWAQMRAVLGGEGGLRSRWRGDSTVSEARLIRVVTTLPVVLVGAAAWVFVAQGLVPIVALLTASAAVAGWSRLPVNRWYESPTGASLINAAKAASAAIGALVSAAVLGGYSDRVAAAVAAGADPAALTRAADLRLLLLTAAVVGLNHLFGRWFTALRIGTFDELRVALAGTGTDPATIIAKLLAAGPHDIGTVRALYLSETWRPRGFARHRLAARARLQQEVGLDADEQDALLVALRRFEPPASEPRRTALPSRVTAAFMANRLNAVPALALLPLVDPVRIVGVMMLGTIGVLLTFLTVITVSGLRDKLHDLAGAVHGAARQIQEGRTEAARRELARARRVLAVLPVRSLHLGREIRALTRLSRQFDHFAGPWESILDDLTVLRPRVRDLLRTVVAGLWADHGHDVDQDMPQTVPAAFDASGRANWIAAGPADRLAYLIIAVLGPTRTVDGAADDDLRDHADRLARTVDVSVGYSLRGETASRPRDLVDLELIAAALGVVDPAGARSVRSRFAESMALQQYADLYWRSPADVFEPGWNLLGELARRPSSPPGVGRSALLDLLRRSLADEMEGGATAIAFLDDPGWVTTASGEPNRIRSSWEGANRRERYAFGIALVATGTAPWMAELPKRRRAQRYLDSIISWQTDPGRADLRDGIAAVLAEIPERDQRSDRAQHLGAWLRMVLALDQIPVAFVTDDVRAVLERLPDELRERAHPDRPGLIDAAAEAIRAGAIRGALEALGLADVPAGISASVPWEVLLGHHDVAVPTWNRLLEAYLTAGGGSTGTAAFWAKWRDLAPTVDPVRGVARERAPPDSVHTIAGAEVVIGVVLDPIEILQLGYPGLGGSCLDCVHGIFRASAQTCVLHPDIAVLNAWRRLPDGRRGQRIARLAVLVTDDGLKPLGVPYPRDVPGAVAAFDTYLRAWAASARPESRVLPADRSGGSVRLTDAGLGLREFYSDATGRVWLQGSESDAG